MILGNHYTKTPVMNKTVKITVINYKGIHYLQCLHCKSILSLFIFDCYLIIYRSVKYQIIMQQEFYCNITTLAHNISTLNVTTRIMFSGRFWLDICIYIILFSMKFLIENARFTIKLRFEITHPLFSPL